MNKSDKQKSIPVTRLKSLGDVAPEFRLPVTIHRLDGSEVSIAFTAKALRKTEWAAMRDALLSPDQDADQAVEAAPAPKFSFLAVVGGEMKKGTDLLLSFATGWDLEDDFSAATLVDMEDRFAGSLSAALTAYDAAIFHGRLGN